MDYLLPLLGIAAANLLAAMSPGPAFVVVVRTAVTASRPAAFAAAAGMVVGAVVWAAAAIFGMALLFSEFVWVYRVVQFVGGAYLAFVAFMIWRGASDPVELAGPERSTIAPWRAFAGALALQLSNPKVVVFFGSVFVALLPAHAPAWVWVAALLIVLFNETLWYTILALSFSAAPVQRAYGRVKPWLDRAVACVLGGLGLKLVLDSR